MESPKYDEYYRVSKNIAYYRRLLNGKGTLTPTQQRRFDELSAKLEELKPTTRRRKYATTEEYLEANRQNAKQRYQRIKDTEEFKASHRAYSKKYYEKKKALKSEESNSD